MPSTAAADTRPRFKLTFKARSSAPAAMSAPAPGADESSSSEDDVDDEDSEQEEDPFESDLVGCGRRQLEVMGRLDGRDGAGAGLSDGMHARFRPDAVEGTCETCLSV